MSTELTDHDPLKAIVEAQEAIRTLAALRAAGVDTEPGLHVGAIELLTSTVDALAILEDTTPRRLLANAIEVAPEDGEWRTTILWNATEHGKRLVERERRRRGGPAA
jgi:hypothetical protein